MLSGILLTHAAARRERKLPFFFSRFNFDRMKERGNTHFCFACLGGAGYRPGIAGEPTNHIEEDRYNGMDEHDESHANFVLGNADKYRDPWSWLAKETPDDFPCVIHIPSV